MSLISNKKRVKLDETVFHLLQNGKMPSTLEMKKFIRQNEKYNKSDKQASMSTYYVNNNPLVADVINNFIDEYKIDLKAIKQTIDDCWNELDIVLDKAEKISLLSSEAETLGKACKMTMSYSNLADSHYNITALGYGISPSSWDLSLSDNILLDSSAGTISLAKNSFIKINKSDIKVTSNNITSNTVIEKGEVFGSYENIFDSILTNRFIQFVYSKEQDAVISNELILSIPLSSINEISINTTSKYNVLIDVYTSYDGSNYKYFGSSNGTGTINVLGPKTNAKDIKLIITKNHNDAIINNKYVYAYIFDLAEIDIYIASYSDTGFAITTAISNSKEILNTYVDLTGQNLGEVYVYIANDIEGAVSKDDFIWKRIYDTQSWISQPTTYIDTITIDKPSKFYLGPGSTYDIYQIDTTSDSIIYAEEGYNQVEVRYKTVSYATTAAVSRFDFGETDTPKLISNIGTIQLEKSRTDFSATVPNYFHLSTKIYSSFSSSAEFNISTDIEKTKVYINGQDITSLIRNNSVYIPLSVGENKLEIVALVDTDEESLIVISPKDNINIAINKLEISTPNAMSSSTPKICIYDGSVLVNKYTAGKTYKLYKSQTSSSISNDIRLMVKLVKTSNGSSPVINDIILKVGV